MYYSQLVHLDTIINSTVVHLIIYNATNIDITRVIICTLKAIVLIIQFVLMTAVRIDYSELKNLTFI